MMTVDHNVSAGRGTFIKAPGYKGSIEARFNTHIGDGDFINTSKEDTKTKAWRDRALGRIAVGVLIVVLGALAVRALGL